MLRIQFGAYRKAKPPCFFKGAASPEFCPHERKLIVRGRGQYAPNLIWRRRNFTDPIKSEAIIFLFTFIGGQYPPNCQN